MASGKYDRRVTIIRAAGTSRDAAGELLATPASETTTWASVRPSRGRERFDASETGGVAPMLFRFRWREDLVRVTDQLRHDGRLYDVNDVREVGRRREIEAEAVARSER